MQHCLAQLYRPLAQLRFFVVVDFTNGDVDTRTVVIEGFARQHLIPPRQLEQPFLEQCETDHHISHLHAGIVDIVIGLNMIALRAQHAYNCIANAGVTQVTHMRSFITIDIRVFNDDFGPHPYRTLTKVRACIQHSFDNFFAHLRAIQAEIEIARLRHSNRVDSGSRHIA